MSSSLVKNYLTKKLCRVLTFRAKCQNSFLYCHRFFHCFLWIFSHIVTNNIFDMISKYEKHPTLGPNKELV